MSKASAVPCPACGGTLTRVYFDGTEYHSYNDEEMGTYYKLSQRLDPIRAMLKQLGIAAGIRGLGAPGTIESQTTVFLHHLATDARTEFLWYDHGITAFWEEFDIWSYQLMRTVRAWVKTLSSL